MDSISPQHPSEESPLLFPLRLRRHDSDTGTTTVENSARDMPTAAIRVDTAQSEPQERQSHERECESGGCAAVFAVVLVFAAVVILIVTCGLLIQEGERCKKTGDCRHWERTTPPGWEGPASPFPTMAPLWPIINDGPFKPGPLGTASIDNQRSVLPGGIAFLTPYRSQVSQALNLPRDQMLADDTEQLGPVVLGSGPSFRRQ